MDVNKYTVWNLYFFIFFNILFSFFLFSFLIIIKKVFRIFYKKEERLIAKAQVPIHVIVNDRVFSVSVKGTTRYPNLNFNDCFVLGDK